MRWKDKRTQVVENAATAVLVALREQIEAHHKTVAAVREALKQGEAHG